MTDKRNTITHTVVDVNPVPGGPPVPVGVISVCRTRENAPPIEVLFAVPDPSLIGADLATWTDEQIAGLAERNK